jgi:hypothetical protein
MHLRDPNFVPVVHGLTTILVGTDNARRLPRLVLLQHTVVDHVKLVVEHNVAINFLNDVVFDEDEAIYLDVQGEAISIETCTYLLVNFDENIICWLFD